MFIKIYINELDTSMRIGDMGAGHLRNLKLFEELGFCNLYALDREKTDNPMKVNLKEFVIQDLENGIPYPDYYFDITLCNYVLMFIDQLNIKTVLDELLRVTNKFLVIETYPKKHVEKIKTFYKDYDFLKIADYINKSTDFEILQVRNYYEKLIARRKVYG